MNSLFRHIAGLAISLATLLAQNPNVNAAEALQADLKKDRLTILVGNKLFTEYLFEDTEKYPYFFPVQGPRSDLSVTTRREKEYPHHSSLFFGCDRVNGGNYWQEGLERGRIVHKKINLVKRAGDVVEFEQDCRWERPGAEAPFDDHRKITIRAPGPDRRIIDFEVKLTARIKVKIEKTNHSLFSARMAPDLSVKGGGAMINAQGDSGEKATLGKKSPWMDYRGKRGNGYEGMAIFDHPKNPWTPSQWFTRDYGFFSPTPLNWIEAGFIEINAGDSLHFRYRVVVHSDNPGKAELAAEFERFSQ